LFIVNPFTDGLVFYFDENLQYTRGTIFPLLYIFAFSFMLSGTIRLIKYNKLFTREKYRALLMLFIFGVITVSIQWLNRELRVEMLGSALSMLYVSIMVQRPEDRVDPITGLLKYEAYAVDMKKNFANEKHVTSIVANISNFNALNSMLNYDGMNSLLKTIADIITAIDRDLKAYAEIYYLDRGRFRVVLNTDQAELIYLISEKINFVLKQGVSFNGMELNLIAYVCITRCPEDVPDFKTLMLFGNDIHNRTPYTGQVLRASEIARKSPFGLGNELDEIIDKALADRSFKVYYQPIYSTAEKKFVSAEALLRLKDDKYGFISPELFIVAAERSGAIHKIGDFVMEEVCRFIASEEFEKLGLEYIEVNLSVAQCMSPDLSDKILNIMEKYGVSPDKINLEITETAADYAQNIMTENIDKLHSEGFTFSLDDYGTGYSNINRVASLPLTIVKLDKSFVAAEDNQRMWIVLRNT
ncbi:MAG: EAL domain-containing protein, partial [Oscillospiraceae bacterium]|nr:EAL domain-containing protein [Oscillospiraceae bacterium]